MSKSRLKQIELLNNLKFLGEFSYTVGQTIAFQPYYQEGGSSASTNYFHHAGGSGAAGKIRLTVQEISA